MSPRTYVPGDAAERRAYHRGYLAGLRRGVSVNRYANSVLRAAYDRGYDAGVAAYTRALQEATP